MSEKGWLYSDHVINILTQHAFYAILYFKISLQLSWRKKITKIFFMVEESHYFSY